MFRIISSADALRRFLVAACLSLAACAMSLTSLPRIRAQDSVEPSLNSQAVTMADTRRVLRDLEADRLQTRDDAERRLIEMGPQVLPFLPTVTPRTSGELKVRLQRIRQALQQSKSENFFDASTVTLTGTLTIAEAIDAIERQTGNVIELQDAANTGTTEIALEVKDEPFWNVLRKIMEAGKLRINAYGTTEGHLVLGPGGNSGNEVPTFTSGPFLLSLLSVQSTLPFQSGLSGQVNVSFQLTWEPRVKPVFMQVPMNGVQATWGEEQTLSASNPQAAPEIPLNLGSSSAQVDLQLERPPRSATKLDKLVGELVIAVPSDRHQYVFKNFSDGARQSEKFADVTVTLEGARRNGPVYEMRVLVEFGDAQGALDSFRGWVLSNEAYLLDANKRRQENVGLQTYAVTPNAVGIAYLFQINGDPKDYQLIYESPGAISKQTIRYELSDIELP